MLFVQCGGTKSNLPQADMIDGDDMDELIVPPDGYPRVSQTTAITYQQLFRDLIAEYMMQVILGL